MLEDNRKTEHSKIDNKNKKTQSSDHNILTEESFMSLCKLYHSRDGAVLGGDVFFTI